MKLLATLAMLLTASATATPPTVALSGIQKREPIKPSDIPACIWACWEQAGSEAQCDKYDVQCICTTNQTSFTSVLTNCLIRKIDTCSLGDSAAILARVCQGGFDLTSAAARRRAMERALRPSCPGGRLDNDGDYAGYECVDVQRDLEACGGCPGVDGVDCTALDEGAVDVACVQGQCKILS